MPKYWAELATFGISTQKTSLVRHGLRIECIDWLTDILLSITAQLGDFLELDVDFTAERLKMQDVPKMVC